MNSSSKSLETRDAAELAELKAHGIIVSKVPIYEWNGYRYSNARDAIAAAKRGR